MIFLQISTFLIIVFNFLYSLEQFPPLNAPPTFSNAKRYNLIKYYKNSPLKKYYNQSKVKNLHQKRNQLTRNEAIHLLNRTTFGPTLEEIEYVIEIGLDATLDLLFQKLEKPILEENWIYHHIHPDFSQLSSTQKDSIRNNWELNYVGLQSWWLDLMNQRGLNITEMMTLFWHDHFASSAEVVKFTPSMYLQNQLFRKFSFGNFKDLVKSINYDPAMLQWLDNDQNYFVNENNFTINENYARELLELFTMGEGNYTQFDIEEAARSLTGIDTDGLTSFYSPTRHDHGEKTIFGNTGDIGVDDLVDLIFEQEETALYLCRKLYKWFVYEIPDEEIVHQMSIELVSNNFEIEPVLRLLLSSNHFFDNNFRGSKYKNPIYFSLGSFRQLYIDFETKNELIIWSNMILGQTMFYPPDVSGWDGYRSWINTYTLPYRKSMTNNIVDGYENQLLEWENVIEFAEKFTNPNNPEILLEEMINYLLAIRPSQQTVDLLLEELLDGAEIYDWYLYDPGSEQRLKTVIKHIMRLEEFQVR
ncbi:MAG: hypothetical protein CMF96_05705 [Candidatus Marinimicrobia bacterium]|nr:hypothetical protein [Candidatus Neomarinimicrobiota bacterium]